MRRPSWIGGRTGVRALAKVSNPDSSCIASFVQRLPRFLRLLLLGKEREYLTELARQSMVSARGSGSRSGLVCPSEQWMATFLGCSVRTIVRYNVKLVKLGLIRIVHRRPIGEAYQSNLYFLGHQMVAAIQRALNGKNSNEMAYDTNGVLGYCKETKSPVQQGRGSLREEKIDSDRLSKGSDFSESGPSEPQTLGEKGKEAYEAAMRMFKRLAQAPQPS